MDGSTSVEGDASRWQTLDSKTSVWPNRVLCDKRAKLPAAPVWTVLIDSGTAAGPRWVIGWFFFLPHSGCLLGQTKSLVEQWSHCGLNEHQRAASQRRRHTPTSLSACARKFRSLSRIFIGANKSETWVYLSACCQTVKKIGSHPPGKEIRFDLWSVEDFVASSGIRLQT